MNWETKDTLSWSRSIEELSQKFHLRLYTRDDFWRHPTTDLSGMSFHPIFTRFSHLVEPVHVSLDRRRRLLVSVTIYNEYLLTNFSGWYRDIWSKSMPNNRRWSLMVSCSASVCDEWSMMSDSLNGAYSVDAERLRAKLCGWRNCLAIELICGVVRNSFYCILFVSPDRNCVR